MLDDICLDYKINYNLDSNHTISITLDSSLAEEKGIINKIGFKQIIYAKTLENNYEPFVLTGIDKILDDTVELVGIHWLTEVVSKIFCLDLKPRQLNANNMLKHIVENSEEYKRNEQYTRDIEISGNIDILVNCNLWQTSLGDYLEELQALYGNCEVRKKGFMISLVNKVGRDYPVYEVNYGVNLISNTISEEYLVYKGVLGKGYNGILGDIQYTNKVKSGMTKVVQYKVRLRDDQEDDESYIYYDTEEQCKQALNELAKKEVENLSDIVVTYDTKYLDLATVEESNTTEKTFLEVGDVVNTKIDKYNLNINTRVFEFIYDGMVEEIEDVTLSNADIGSLKVPTLNSVSKEVENKPSREEVTSTTRKEISDFINAGFGGYVMIYKDEIYIMDSPKKENAVKCLRINMNGIAGSTTGWQGPYNVAITVDGQIIADRMTTGILKSLNGESWFNLDNGDAQITGELRSVNGDEWVGLNAGGLTFQDWHKQEQVLRVASANFTNRDMNGVVFAMPKYSDFIGFSYIDKEDLSNGWTTSDTQYNFLEMWSSDQLVDGFQKNKGISFYARAFFNGGIRVKSASDNSYATITGTSTYNNGTGITKKLLGLYGDNGVILGYKNADSLTARLIVSEECFAGTGDTITSFGNWNFQAYTLHNVKLANYTLANTYVNLETKSIAEVSALETNSTDNVRYVYKDITSKDNKIVLNIPNEYLGRDYDIVGVAKFGFGDYAITSKEENRFIIETDREMTMNIEISIE
ncbi:hypothetical protein [Clostridium saudiense]|uniref:hypothetical protein n=2 Tax=Clostridium saudiense TaxID=1414720 RepID=UPI0018A94DE5|nr:hypothetical protein [Clostridium saudiense]